MKRMSLFVRIAAAVAVLALSVCAFAGCTGEPTAKYRVGVVQLTQHVALDAATKGFTDTLKEKLGDDVVIDVKNASNDFNTCGTIVSGFVSNNVDLILANATPALQAAAAATGTIPILGTSVTDFASALEIDNWNGKTGRNISGTSDLAPLADQAKMVKELFPDKKKVGLLYCSSEANSVYQCNVIQVELEALGYTVSRHGFTDSNDIAAVTQTACDNSDVIYVPTDNTVADNTEVIANVAVPAGVPIVAGESGICSGCGVATLSIDYYDIGVAAAEMAYEILVNGKDPADMDVRFSEAPTKKYNAELCQQYGITPPEGYVAIG